MSTSSTFKEDLSSIKQSFSTKLNYIQDQWQDNVATSFFSLIESETQELQQNLLRALDEYQEITGKLYKKMLEYDSDHKIL